MTVPYTGEGRQPNILAPCIIFSILSPLAVALRFYSRRLAHAGLWWDDWTVLAALPIALGFNVLMLWGLSVGFGALPAPERAHQLGAFFKALYASEVIYNTALPLVKASILLLYRRIFPTRSMTIGVCILGALNLLWFFGTEPTIIFQCTPIRKSWYHELPGKCFDLREFLLGQAITSIIIDAMTLCLPVRAVMSLKLPVKRRLMVSAVFLIGLFALGCSIIRLPYILSTLKNNTPYTDLYVFEPGNIWSLAELHVALICACLPTINPIFRHRNKSANRLKDSSYPGSSSGSDRTRSIGHISPRPKASLEMNALHVDDLSDDWDFAGALTHANHTSAVESDSVELGHPLSMNRPEPTHTAGLQEIGVQTDIQVFSQAK